MTRTATAREVLTALRNARIVEDRKEAYGYPLRLTTFGEALVTAAREDGPTNDTVALDNLQIPGLFVVEGISGAAVTDRAAVITEEMAEI